MHSAHIAYSYLVNVLGDEHAADIRAYTVRVPGSTLGRMALRIKRLLGVGEFSAYRSFGVSRFESCALTSVQHTKADKLFTEVYSGLNSLRNIEELTIDGIWIGDLVYDTYLMWCRQPTIDTNRSDFQHSLRQSLECLIFWGDYFNANDVRAICVSHCVYDLAIPMRVAISRNIPAFQANATHVYRLSQQHLFAYNDFVDFPNRFAKLPEEIRKAGLSEAKQRIARRFSGEVGVDMAYSTKSAYGNVRHTRLLRESERKKILVATHCFFDSPHSYGCNLFPDFYEWLEFLGGISHETDYDWYIKTHPDYLPGTKQIIDAFIERYPRFTLLPSDTSHHQIIAEGINVALTVYGTIGFEYAALGVPVINASLNNPHIAYDFNLNPPSVDEYQAMLLSLDKLNLTINKRQVHEYYFMRHIYNTENIFFDNYEATLLELGGYDQQFTSNVYNKWLAEWSVGKHQTIVNALRTFIESGDFRMDYTHFGREFTFDSIGALV